MVSPGRTGPPGGGRPRVRFAPSPTGFLHVGSARAALFNWLFARHEGGTFVLRIEDTDELRNREEWVDGIMTSLAWLGMTPDEGPYRQSARRDLHDAAADRLWTSGHLYACACTGDEVRERTRGNPVPGYDGHCRDLGLDRGPGRALRFRVPDEGVTVVDDIVRGRVEFPNAAIEDFVVVKSSGQPLFVLANVVDDAEMAISHVIRGEDLLPSTPKGIFLWRALQGDDTPLPAYAHLPLLVNKERKKLSKRRDEVAVEVYRAQGFLPDAFVNALALLGWGDPDGREILSMSELVDAFRLEDVNRSPAFFDVDKLRHTNGEYIRAMDLDTFVAACDPFVHGDAAPWPAERFDPDVFAAIAPLVQERVAVLGDVAPMVDFFFVATPDVDPDAWKAVTADAASGEILDKASVAYSECPWEAPALHAATVAVAEAVGRKLGKAQMPVRVAVTGRRVGPPLFESLELLGRDTVLGRLASARSQLDSASA